MYWCQHVIAPMLRNNVSIVSPSTACSALCKCNGLSCCFSCAVNKFDYSFSSKYLFLFQHATSTARVDDEKESLPQLGASHQMKKKIN